MRPTCWTPFVQVGKGEAMGFLSGWRGCLRRMPPWLRTAMVPKAAVVVTMFWGTRDIVMLLKG